MEEESVLDEVKDIVDAAKEPGTFSIVNLLRERAYPKDSIKIYIDEESAYLGGEIDAKIKTTKSESEVEELTTQREEVIEKMKSSAITIHVVGMSESSRSSLLKQARKKYPVEHSREINPVNGEMVKEEKDSPERDELFTDLLWQASIQKIEDAEGNIQENLGFTDVSSMRSMLPLASVAKVTEAIEKLRVATAVFMMEVNEDFLQKS